MTWQSFISLKRNRWLAAVSAGMIAVSLTIVGGFFLLAVNVNQFITNIESNVEIAVFLEANADIAAAEKSLKSLDGVRDLSFVSRDEGLREFSLILGDSNLLKGLEGENNPLPDLFMVTAHDAELVSELAQRIKSMAGVEHVDYGEELVSSLLKLTGWLNTFLLFISAFLAAAAVFLIITTIRLSVLSRQEEISIMKYLGAGDWFIRFPFLFEGIMVGWTGALVALLGLGFVYHRLAAGLLEGAVIFLFQPVTALEKLLPIYAGVIILGTIMGGVGSIISIRKFLRV
ncbi:MAG TPA: ABC transporter permease [Firmicutes bacterium]|nr:ABC transporter permease [Bacillota bacterium]